MTLQLEECPCYLCGSEERAFWGAENGFSAWKCAACGLVYVSPRPTAEAITSATQMGQHRTETGAIDVVGSWSDRKVQRYKRIFSAMYADIIRAERPVRWLDIGAGFGEAVAALKDILPPGSSVIGVEPMAPKVAVAQKRGVPIEMKELSELDGPFDVISLINLFSHIPDFGGFLGEVRALLAPDGDVFVETANGGELASSAEYPDALFLPDHLMFCGRETLTRYLKDAGFDVTAFHAERRDTALWTAKSVVKRALGRPAKITVPYASAYRVIMMRAALKMNAMTEAPREKVEAA